ncbi:hypothetical protein G6F46_003427 [Rhizopus delemar]|nr:hypothetical protein G6F55_000873 [Rhizopus delemar]KAG1548581.1 hypothetical protein G6F51_003577 [Rhizopus arrhizus]KAG1523713.1 hypothetical protein G6F52_004795 [Rhizopus delemar]KAG1573033.1 hypothetical protein G6F50_003207 [Rhizopus delemar]KAG1588995.1 hypothetical protein G6F48_004903 [Rhizopus delemar]
MTNSNDNIWKDLISWQTEINKKDSALIKSKPVHDKEIPPIRRSTEIVLDNQKPKGLNTLTPQSKQKNIHTSQKPAYIEKAEIEKVKGNEYFVKQDFRNAQLHYTKAIEINPTVSVYYVNRSLTHIKLNNFIEAERDCTKGIELDPKNTKAYWRRSTALQNLGRLNEAKEDLVAALKLEPKNAAITEDLRKVTLQLDSARKQKEQKKEDNDKSTRVIPINIINESFNPESFEKSLDSRKKQSKPSGPSAEPKNDTANNNKKPVKATTFISSQSSTANARTEKEKASLSDKPSITKSVAKTESAKPEAKVAAVLKDKTLEPTTETDKNSINKKEANTTQVKAVPIIAKSFNFSVPRTNFEFERDWKTCKARGNDVLYQYFQSIPPSSFSSLFKSSLESKYFEDMIHILATKYKTAEDMFNVLENLSRVRRLDMLVMFLSKKQEEELKSLFDKIKSSNVPAEKLAQVAKIYKIHI